ncbi:MAG: hypothetical protein JXC32_11360, partial [Anaerolineae bacterium]|nr:hypothetical protein [Anaerolineae bacterium]
AERFSRLRESFDDKTWGVDTPSEKQMFYWALFTSRLSDRAFARLRRQLRLPARLAQLHAQQAALRKASVALATAEQPGEIAAHLDEFDLESLALAWLTTDDTTLQDKLTAYARTWRHVGSHLSGDDLKELGYRPGPLFREILQGLRVARLDGAIRTRDEEIAWVEARFTPDATRPSPPKEAR